MPQDPESFLMDLLKDKLPKGCSKVRILDREADLMAEVRLSRDVATEDYLYEHVERVAAWERAVAKLRHLVAVAEATLSQVEGQAYIAYWQQLEANERKEMHEHLSDEDEIAADAFHPARRRAREANRVAKGVDAGRWRRNFSDTLVNWHVATDSAVVAAKAAVHALSYQLDQAVGVTRALTQRGVCLNHLAALHRDTSRQ